MSKLLSTTEVCKLLGVSKPTLEKIRRFRECPLPFGRVGRSYVYDREKVLRWAEENARLDPNRPLRAKLAHERRSVAVVAGTSEAE